jgi:hypothetical protein
MSTSGDAASDPAARIPKAINDLDDESHAWNSKQQAYRPAFDHTVRTVRGVGRTFWPELFKNVAGSASCCRKSNSWRRLVVGCNAHLARVRDDQVITFAHAPNAQSRRCCGATLRGSASRKSSRARSHTVAVTADPESGDGTGQTIDQFWSFTGVVERQSPMELTSGIPLSQVLFSHADRVPFPSGSTHRRKVRSKQRETGRPCPLQIVVRQ